MRTSVVFVSALAVLSTGCSSMASLTIYSQPEGAYLSEIGSSVTPGMAPASVSYDPKSLASHRTPDGCYLVKGFRARWVSGATKSMNPIRLCGSSSGDFNITLSRDPADPGLDKDLQFALQLKSVRAQQQQADAASDAAAAAMWSAWSNQKSTVSCNSYKLGNTVQTDCR